MTKQPYLTDFPRTIIANSIRRFQASIRRARIALARHSICGLAVFFDDVLPAQWMSEIDPTLRHRHFGHLPVFWAWCIQILEGNASCGRAVGLLQSWYQEAGLPVPKSDTSSYCQARRRLSAGFLGSILHRLNSSLGSSASERDLWHGLRLKAIDGSSVQLHDTPENQLEYPQPGSQKEGCGFPSMGIVGVCDLSHGGWLEVKTHAGKKHDARMAPLLLGSIGQGDLLLADRAFCSYEFIARLQQRGAECVMRLHQARHRKLDWRRGRKLSPIERLVVWEKPAQKPPGCELSAEEWAALPGSLTLRYVKMGYENRQGEKAMIVVVTTLVDPGSHDGIEVANLYARRWEIEVKLRDVKTTLRMEKLAVKSPEMARKTLTMMLIAYNLMRHAMKQAAESVGKPVNEMSLKWSIDLMTASANRFARLAGKPRKSSRAKSDLIDLLATKVIDIRPFRSEPRAVKQRPKCYQLLTAPRHVFRVSDTRSNRYQQQKKSA